MGLIFSFLSNPLFFLILLILLIYSVIIHEVSHGFVALLFGDDTAKLSGRLTFNPKSHIDIIGMLVLFFIGFGWARPVPVNYNNLKNFRIGLFFVAIAGPVSNIIIATFAIFLSQFPFFSENNLISNILFILIRINITLGAFNLIPIPPLDGSKILMSFFPEHIQYKFIHLEHFGILLLLILLFSGVLDPVIRIFNEIILRVILFILKLFS